MPSFPNHLIRSVIYFDNITQEELDYISDHSIFHTYTANENIFLEGDPAEGLWIIGTGRVKIFKLNHEGSEHILHLLGPGQTFNDIGALDGGNNPANASALSAEVHTWLVPLDVITTVLKRNPQVNLGNSLFKVLLA